jgi:hypothetical protein
MVSDTGEGNGERCGAVMDVQALIDSAVETEQYCPALASDRSVPENGIIFRGVAIKGFTSSEEELVQAFMSRIPPELIVGVKQIIADRRLQPIHGRYDKDKETIYFNPHTFTYRQKLGKGVKISHPQLTMVHEFGHAFFNAQPEQVQDEWRDLSGWMIGSQVGQERAYIEKRPGWPQKTSKWTHKKGVQFTRHYAEKNADEDAADVFAFVLLGKPAQAGTVKAKWMAQLMMSKIHKYPQASLEGPVQAYGTSEGVKKAWDTRGRGMVQVKE